MAEFISNAAGQVISRGDKDLSGRQVPRAAIPIPQHLPKFYIQAAEGKEGEQILGSAERVLAYGAETFNPLSKFFNMSTLFANITNAAGNVCAYFRVVPTDAEYSTIRIGLDLLGTGIPLYERDENTGQILLDGAGLPVLLPEAAPVQGIEAAVVVKQITNNDFGGAIVGPGARGDGEGSSMFYPVMDLRFYSKTAAGDLAGISIDVPTISNSGSMPSKLMAEQEAYPFNITVYRKPNATGAPVVVETLNGDQSLTFVLKPNVINPETGNQISLQDTFVRAYQNLTDARYPKKYATFDTLHVYETELADALSQMHTCEAPLINGFSDITASSTSKYLINPFTAKSSQGVPYESIRIVTCDGSVPISKNKIIYATGGSDGTLTQAAFNAAVKADLERYLDPEDEYNDIVLHPANYFYDCGFDFATGTKHALANVMAVRKDTVVYSCMLVEGEGKLTETIEGDRAISLYARFRDFPESEYYGTPCSRVVMQGRDYSLINSQYHKRVPVLLDLLRMNAEFMGASEGKWNSKKRPDGNPGNILTLGEDINIPWIGPGVRARNWDKALNWVMPSDTGEFFFPHTKTIFSDDTSILTGHLTLAVMSMCNRIGRRAWTRFVGRQNLTGPQLVQEVNNFVIGELNGIFGPEWIVRPRCTITAQDAAYGYRWSLPIEIYGPNMPTVMTLWTETYRSSDLAA